MRIYTADRETGTFIEQVGTFDEGVRRIMEYKADDRSEGNYTADFYDIVDENHCSVRMAYEVTVNNFTVLKRERGKVDGLIADGTPFWMEYTAGSSDFLGYHCFRSAKEAVEWFHSEYSTEIDDRTNDVVMYVSEYSISCVTFDDQLKEKDWSNMQIMSRFGSGDQEDR